MLDAEAILAAIPQALDTFEVPGDLPHGKICDFYVTPDGQWRVLIATDRVSVLDHEVGLVPYRGQALNELSVWWFEHTTDIIPNHVVSMPDPNVTIAHEARPIPLAVVVRGYITGVTPTSLWTRYEAGEREIYGIRFPDGLKKNDPLPHPIVTATTKSTIGRDDRHPLNDVVNQNYVSAVAWKKVQAMALALFQRGQEIAGRSGLILIDSKYEFGFDVDTGNLMLIDHIHTPESSRYWKADTYEALRSAGKEPQNLDKEFVRLWYRAQQYPPENPWPPLNETLIVALSQAYQQVYEMITGNPFQPAAYPAHDRIKAALAEFA